MVKSKDSFWIALVLTILIFVLGILIGWNLENSRTNEIQNNLLKSEISLLDQQTTSESYNFFSIDCEKKKKSIFEFADKIYYEAKELEEIDAANKFINTLQIVHKRYDLLRVILWLDSISYKNKCGGDFNTIVYLFDYETSNIPLEAKQNAFSKSLIDFKYLHPNEILLIPLASNLNLTSIEQIKTAFNVTSPSIIVNEKEIINELKSPTELENIIFKSNKE